MATSGDQKRRQMIMRPHTTASVAYLDWLSCKRGPGDHKLELPSKGSLDRDRQVVKQRL
jgi:hypothetical protein